MIVRPIVMGEAGALAALARQTYVDAFGHSFIPSDLDAQLQNALSDAYFTEAITKDTVLVAEVSGELIGFVQFGDVVSSIEATMETDQELRRLYVLGSFQNQGVGGRLMAEALTHPRLKRANAIYLDVWERNEGARRFYQRHGFAVVGAKAFHLASGVAGDRDLIMVRRVKPD